jgi:lipopolysaccharide heptosyltransferase II
MVARARKARASSTGGDAGPTDFGHPGRGRDSRNQAEASVPQELRAFPARILVHEVNWLGDLVMTLPALHAIRRTFPTAHLSVLIDSRLAAFFDGTAWIDEVIPLQRPPRARALAQLPRLAAQLRARRFDLAVVFPNSFESALRVALARIPIRAGFSRDGRGWLLTRRATPTRELMSRHQVHYWLAMLKATLDIEGEPGGIAPDVDAKHLARMREWLAARRVPERRLIAIAPAAAYGPAKEWPPGHYAALISALAGRNVQCVMVGSPGERARCEAIAAACGCATLIAAGQTHAGELMALLSLCDGFVGNDSGAAHVASVLGIPTVAIFGSTQPLRTGPLGPKTEVLYRGLACSPCLARTCRFGHYNCLREIAPPGVIGALEKLDALNASA